MSPDNKNSRSSVTRPDAPATPAQISYLRKLLNEAFGARYAGRTWLDVHHLNRVTRGEASKAIDELTRAKANGWKVVETASDQVICTNCGREHTLRSGYNSQNAFCARCDKARGKI